MSRLRDREMMMPFPGPPWERSWATVSDMSAATTATAGRKVS
jgi:hypothetical protein